MKIESPDTEPWVSEAVAALFASIGARRVAEIGVWRACTSRKILESLPENGELWGFDLDPHPEGKIDDRRFHLILGDSTKTVPAILGNETMHAVFVDGDHTLPAVFEDFKNAWKSLRVGGILCAHDPLSWPTVKDAANEVCPKHIIIPTHPWPEIKVTGLLIAVKE